MTTWVVGDVQGCATELAALLDKLQLDPEQDRLWFVGDLVNRGPDSLTALRMIHSLGDAAVVVLGNHDLHLLACRWGDRKPHRKDNFHTVLEASDGDALCEWLVQQPLAHYDAQLDVLMTHAGVLPQWSVAEALACAQEVQQVLADATLRGDFFSQMYGDQPQRWDAACTGMDRLRFITNVFTRMRVFDAQGRLDLRYKAGLDGLPEACKPWFVYPRRSAPTRLVFGHWAALECETGIADIVAVDNGCVWGRSLLAVSLEDGQCVEVPAQA